MKEAMAAVEAFHKAFGAPVVDRPVFPNDPDLHELRIELIREEFAEYRNAVLTGDLVEMADALADMVYVICGTALVYGIPLADVFDEVQRSNMSKLGEDGQPIHRDDGKILKGPNYSPPDIAAVMAGAGWGRDG